MKAFVERLCEHTGIVRAGPEADSYGAPFDYAVAFVVDGHRAIIKALASDGKMTVGHAKAAFRELAKLGLRATWERM